ncbi:MAG: spondin domain-containing protein [Chloroflexota bacterium]
MNIRRVAVLAGIFLLVTTLVVGDLSNLSASPRAQASPSARYRLTFNAEWSVQSHPTDFPSNPHFSGLAGGTHTSAVSFWAPGAIASDGIEQMAETGSTNILQSEVNAAVANGTAGRVLAGGNIPTSPDSVTMEIFIRREFPLVTIVAMLAPSPDWFVGVRDFPLIDGQGNWINRATVSLDPWDAGTDSSPSYVHSENDTQPPEPIHNMRGVTPFSNARVGTFTFERIDVPANPTNTPTQTPTPAPPTVTPIPPTATSIPPTATPILPTATSIPPTVTPLPPTATSQPPDGQCGGLRQEAESGMIGSGATGTGAFLIGQNGAASGGQYVEARDTRPNGQFNPNGNIAFCVNVPSPGLYGIRVRAQALDRNRDSLYVYVDGAPANGNTWYLWATGNYEVTDLWVAPDNGTSYSRLEVQLSAGEHQIAFSGRESGARLDWFQLIPLSGGSQPTPTPQPTVASTSTPIPTAMPTPTTGSTPVAGCGGLQQEAEQGVLSGLFTVGSDSAASGGTYVHVANGEGNRGSTLDASQKMSYCMTVNSPGTYRIMGWTYSPSGGDNSFYVRVNGQPSQGLIWHTSINTAYNGEYVVAYNPSTNRFDPAEFNLGAGQHTIEFLLREDGTRLDRIELVQAVSAAQTTSGFEDNARLMYDISLGDPQLDERLYLPLLR